MVQHTTPATPPTTVLIVGAGAFGTSLALSLIKGPYAGHEHLITVLDRSASPPAADAASYDYNKIIRCDYTDPFYASLAAKSIAAWRSPEYSPHFHECGVLMFADQQHEQKIYIEQSLAVNSRPEMMCSGKPAYALECVADIKGCYGEAPTAGMENMCSYYNSQGGWAASGAAVATVNDRLRLAGVKFLSGEAKSLLYKSVGHNSTDVKGVNLADGRTVAADLTILATGAWSSRLVPELADDLLPTGQTVGTLQLTKEEAYKYRNVPISFFLDTGFYCFPPDANHVFKFAIHDRGWLDTTDPSLPSVPRTIYTPGCESQEVPEAAKAELRKGLARVYPELAKKEWAGSRLCWYTDRRSGDFLFDYHPSYPSLFLSTGGSGHGFKFFPLLGEFALASLQNRLSPLEKSIWSFYGDASRIDKSRKLQARKILPPPPSIEVQAKL